MRRASAFNRYDSTAGDMGASACRSRNMAALTYSNAEEALIEHLSPQWRKIELNEYKEILEFPRLLMKPGCVLNPRPNVKPCFDEYRPNLGEERRGTASHEMAWFASEIASLPERLCTNGFD